MAVMKLLQRKSGGSGEEPSELRATLAEHLEELRQRITRILGVTAAATIVCWFFTGPVFELFSGMARAALPKNVEADIAFMGISSSFVFTLQLAFSMGLAVVIPWIVMELWGFIGPGLRPHEKRPLKIVAPVSVLLFATGVFLAWVIMPVTYTWFFGFVVGYQNTKVILEAQEIIFFPISIMLAFGAGFQLPIVIYFLAWLDIISPHMLLRYWRHGIVGTMVAAAVITPSGDIPTMMMMGVPLTILYFATLFAATWSKKSVKDAELDNLD
jgi:sec-independent protein translocase protein TatC